MRKTMFFLATLSLVYLMSSRMALAGGDKVRGDDEVNDNIEGPVYQVQENDPQGWIWD